MTTRLVVLIATVISLAMTASPSEVRAPLSPPIFDPSVVSTDGLFRGSNALLTDEHTSWLDTLCSHETRNIAEHSRDNALSKRAAIGRCQVLEGTARYVGFTGPTYVLFFKRINKEAAARVVADCLDRRGWRNTFRAVAYCYSGGKNRRYRVGSEWYWYAINVEKLHRQRTGN